MKKRKLKIFRFKVSYLKKFPGQRRRRRVTYYKTERRYVWVTVKPPRRRYKKISRISKIPKRRAWISARDYMARLRRTYDIHSMDLIYRRNLKTDLVSPYDSFVWSRELAASGDSTQPIYRFRQRPLRFRSARVWFLLYHVQNEDYIVGSRSALFPHEVNTYSAALAEVTKIRESVVDYYTQEKFDEYFDFQGFLAFTVFFSGERMPTK